MEGISSSNKRIVINTIILYAKLIITIVISFVTSRLVLQALGADDYGLYNVVGGVVSMLNILGTSMVATSYRYMAVEIGKEDQGNPNKVFNTIFLIHLILAFLLLLFGETLGVFYIENYLNVSSNKIPDALFVFRLSLLTTAFAVIAIPSNGLIISKEKFLFISIVETINALLKMGLIVALMYINGNKLRYYAVFLAICQLFLPVSYQIYCYIKDREVVRWAFNRNWKDYKEILSFTGWIVLGASAVICQSQGSAVVINHFFGTILNAAFGLAVQVHVAVGQFTGTLRQAFFPQIMKNQEYHEDRSLSLVYCISRYSYLMMTILVFPLMFNMRELLRFWLGTPPEYTQVFINFLLINGLVENLRCGFDASIQATGKIRSNQIGYFVINLSLLPLMCFAYRLGCPPYFNVLIMILLTAITVIFQCAIMKKITSFVISEYIKLTILPVILTTITIVVPLLLVDNMINNFIVKLGIGIIWSIMSIFFCGMTRIEKKKVKEIIKRILIDRIII